MPGEFAQTCKLFSGKRWWGGRLRIPEKVSLQNGPQETAAVFRGNAHVPTIILPLSRMVRSSWATKQKSCGHKDTGEDTGEDHLQWEEGIRKKSSRP